MTDDERAYVFSRGDVGKIIQIDCGEEVVVLGFLV